MDGTRFRLDLNLRNLSLISIAAKLWDSQDIKNQIKNHFSPVCEHVHVYPYPDENWCEISKLVVQYANSINLPPKLSVLLKNTIKLIGLKIYDWIFYVTETFKLDLIFTQKIYFSFGRVDEIKIFDLYWRDLLAADNFGYESKNFTRSERFSLACLYGCEKFVKERKNEMLDEFSKFYPDIKTGDEIYNILAVAIRLTVGYKYNMPGNVDPSHLMFELCLEAGSSKAARFFLKKSDEVEKVSNLTNFAKICWRTYKTGFLKEKCCENLLFLISQMGEKEKFLFFRDYADKIIKLFLPVWPYQELIVDLLKYDWNIESSRLPEIADFLIWFIERMNLLEFPLDNELMFQIMQKIWGKITVDEKLRFLKKNRELTSCFFLTLNPDILNLVFNDPSFKEVNREEIDSIIKDGFWKLVKVGKFDFLNTMIETIFNFIPEPKEFLKEKFLNYYHLQNLIENDKTFGLVNQFLDWSTESEAERAMLKNEINTIFICRYLTEPPHQSFKFDLANKFLKWRLETDAEVKSFKEEMKSYNFVILRILGYVRIKSGDLSWLRPGDSLVMHPDENPYDTADGLTFFKFQDGAELNRGAVLSVELSSLGFERDFILGCCNAMTCRVDFVGTKVGDFVLFNVRSIWSNKRDSDFNLDKSVNLSNAFITFCYETDQEVLEFKKTKLLVLVTENLIEFLLDTLHSYWHVPVNFLDDFCKFCMIDSEKIEEIKMQKQRDIGKFFDTYLIDHRNFQLVDYYLNWLFGESEKTEVCKKFLNSSNNGALLCVSYLKECGDANPLGNRDPKICRWLSLIDDMEKLKNDVFALYENTPEWFPALLERSAHSDVNTVG